MSWVLGILIIICMTLGVVQYKHNQKTKKLNEARSTQITKFNKELNTVAFERKKWGEVQEEWESYGGERGTLDKQKQTFYEQRRDFELIKRQVEKDAEKNTRIRQQLTTINNKLIANKSELDKREKALQQEKADFESYVKATTEQLDKRQDSQNRLTFLLEYTQEKLKESNTRMEQELKWYRSFGVEGIQNKSPHLKDVSSMMARRKQLLLETKRC